MIIDVLVSSPCLVSILWGVLSIFDFTATMLYSKAYREFLSSRIVYEGGMEMNPAFERDVRDLRWFSPRYILLVLFVASALYFAGIWISVLWFEALAGGALLLILMTDLRHVENLSMVWFLRKDPDGFRGRIEQSYRLSQQRVTVGSLNIGILFSIISILTGRRFFVGGALISILYAIRHYLLSNRQLPGRTSVH